MKSGQVPDGDSLFRHCIYPLSFGKHTGFVHEKMWYLELRNQSLHGSLAWERFVPTLGEVHGYGCRLASGINERKQRKGKFKEKDRHYYCGAYRLWGRSLRALSTTPGLSEIMSVEVVHQIEAEEIAHSDVRILLKPGIFDVQGTKTAIVDRLWNSCTGPLKHTCDCDRDILGHQSDNLPTGPAGKYFDTRSDFLRRWSIIRFRILNWIWRNSIKPSVSSSVGRVKSRICSLLWRRLYQD